MNDVGDRPVPAMRADRAPESWSMWFTPVPGSVRIARRQVTRTLSLWGVSENAMDAAVLIISELVTNAIRHCGPRLVLVELTDDGSELLLEVSDTSRRHPRPLIAPSDAENGRGLMLVRAAASAFGARDRDRDPMGKTVWATVEASR